MQKRVWRQRCWGRPNRRKGEKEMRGKKGKGLMNELGGGGVLVQRSKQRKGGRERGKGRDRYGRWGNRCLYVPSSATACGSQRTGPVYLERVVDGRSWTAADGVWLETRLELFPTDLRCVMMCDVRCAMCNVRCAYGRRSAKCRLRGQTDDVLLSC